MHLSSTNYRAIAQHMDGEGLDIVAAGPLNDHYGTRQPLTLVAAHADGRPDDAMLIWVRLDNADNTVEYDRTTGNLADILAAFATTLDLAVHGS
jgi:hypothetical protein